MVGTTLTVSTRIDPPKRDLVAMRFWTGAVAMVEPGEHYVVVVRGCADEIRRALCAAGLAVEMAPRLLTSPLSIEAIRGLSQQLQPIPRDLAGPGIR